MKNKLVIRDYPVSLWVIGVIFLAAGIYVSLRNPGQWLILAAAGIIFVLIVLFASVMTITADKATGLLTIYHRSPLRRSTKEVAIDQIMAIQLEQSHSQDDEGRRSTNYRIAAVMKDGKVIPFRTSYSGNATAKESKVRQLRDFLGVGGVDGTLRGALSSAAHMAQETFEREQETITGENEAERVTNGVRWTLQTLSFGSSPVTRWVSRDFRFSGQFLYLAQKLKGQKTTAPGGPLGALNKMMLKQSMRVYGFDADEAESLEYGETLSQLDPVLEPHFMAFTSDPQTAREILNPNVTTALAEWAKSYPLTQGSNNQLAVLISGEGVFLAMLGLTNPEHVDLLAHLGAGIVLAQR